mmetsp:Transcript_27629/g.87800  ORF Transcript_27629/g.87800 Transcript_27629/m.87800 type:complete len:108 (-) Transcript_27629:504-827(-)
MRASTTIDRDGRACARDHLLAAPQKTNTQSVCALPACATSLPLPKHLQESATSMAVAALEHAAQLHRAQQPLLASQEQSEGALRGEGEEAWTPAPATACSSQVEAIK